MRRGQFSLMYYPHPCAAFAVVATGVKICCCMLLFEALSVIEGSVNWLDPLRMPCHGGLLSAVAG